MEYRNLGNSGLQVSVVGLGCNNFGRRVDLDGTRAVIDACIDQGVNLLDTADVYGGEGASEELMGAALKGKRHQVVLATKFASPMGEGPMQQGGSRKWIIQAVEDSLRRLQTDYIDLYQIHRPDPKTPIEETMRALDDLVTSGKVRYIGHSNFTGWMTAEAHYVARYEHLTPFISAQNEWSLLNRRVEHDLVPACAEYNVGVLPYFPLASGLLTGKYKRGQDAPQGARLAAGPMADRVLTDANFDKVEKLDAFARDRDHTLLELAIGWLASQPTVASVISGATSPEQVKSNVESGSWRLTPEEMAEVDKLTR
ncbi:MAG: aldo/keto reductase [Dehalococcoidia bacterium]|nr:aldo/keto reductase [Dehalococcoidia bacterium]